MDESTERFNQVLYETDWLEIGTCDNPSQRYKLFFKKFHTIYENFFPRKKIMLKTFNAPGQQLELKSLPNVSNVYIINF